MVKMPQNSQINNDMPTEPTFSKIDPGVMKIPDPIITPEIIETASVILICFFRASFSWEASDDFRLVWDMIYLVYMRYNSLCQWIVFICRLSFFFAYKG